MLYISYSLRKNNREKTTSELRSMRKLWIKSNGEPIIYIYIYMYYIALLAARHDDDDDDDDDDDVLGRPYQ